MAGVHGGADAGPLGRKLRRVGAGRPDLEALAALVGAQRGAARGLATALRRVRWPPTLIAALLLPKARRPLLSLLGVAELAAAPARLRAAGPAGVGLGLLDDAAYGTGVTAGCLRLRSLAVESPRSPASSPPRSATGPLAAEAGEALVLDSADAGAGERGNDDDLSRRRVDCRAMAPATSSRSSLSSLGAAGAPGAATT